MNAIMEVNRNQPDGVDRFKPLLCREQSCGASEFDTMDV